MEKYGVQTNPEEMVKQGGGCEREDCPKELDHSTNPPKCAVCGYEHLSGSKEVPDGR